MTAPRELLTARLLLRSFVREDAPAIARLAGDRQIAATTVRIPHPYSENDAAAFLEGACEDFHTGRAIVFAISISSSAELCGAVGLQLAADNKHAELGYWIGVPFWGRGYATEAASSAVCFGFENLRLNRIFAQCFAGNIASQRVLERLGMRHEGRLHQHIQKWGEFIDVENYGLLAGEFRARVKPR